MEHYPDFFARFYDLIYSRLRSDVDTDYFLERIAASKGPVLEVGTGTGRFFAEALKRGADVYGIDTSQAMLNVLKTKLDNESFARVSQQDIRSFLFPFSFDLIIAPFRVFMHLITKEDQMAALQHVYNNLNSGGIFIFDLYIPNPQLLATGMQDAMDFEGEYAPGNVIRRFVTSDNDLIEQVNHIAMRFEWNEGEKHFSSTWNSELRFFFRHELEYLLRASPFPDWTIYGDYKGSPLTKASREFVVVCRKG
jgi:SAM-dependent methyltransferase